jgi:hypothetical protein
VGRTGHPVGAFRTLGRATSVKAYSSNQKILWRIDYVAKEMGVAHYVQPGMLCIVVEETTTAGNGKAVFQCVLTPLGLWYADPSDLVSV